MPRKTYVRTEEHKKKMSQIKIQDTNERFWSKVNIPDLFSCWEWQSNKDSCGYGTFGIRRRGLGTLNTIKAHRFSFLLTYGDIPDNLCVLHKCNNPACVNPAHLYLGTHQDNMRYMVECGRNFNPKGERHPSAKLTEEQAVEIIALLKNKEKPKEIAKLYPISISTIRSIKAKSIWKHIPR